MDREGACKACLYLVPVRIGEVANDFDSCWVGQGEVGAEGGGLAQAGSGPILEGVIECRSCGRYLACQDSQHDVRPVLMVERA